MFRLFREITVKYYHFEFLDWFRFKFLQEFGVLCVLLIEFYYSIYLQILFGRNHSIFLIYSYLFPRVNFCLLLIIFVIIRLSYHIRNFVFIYIYQMQYRIFLFVFFILPKSSSIFCFPFRFHLLRCLYLGKTIIH